MMGHEDGSMQEALDALGSMVQGFMDERNLSQREFARRCTLGDDQMSESTIRRILDRNVEPRMATIELLAAGMNTTPQEIYRRMFFRDQANPAVLSLMSKAAQLNERDQRLLLSLADDMLSRSDDD